GLVSHSGGHTAQKGGYLGTCLGETEDVVHKEKNVLPLSIPGTVTEILRDGKSGKGHTGTRPGRLVHLSEHKGRLGFLHGLFVHFGKIPSANLHGVQEFVPIFDDTGLQHLTQQVVPFPGPFPNAGKDGESPMPLGNIVYQFLDKYGLTHPGTAEESDLTTLGIGFDQVDNLDPSEKYLCRS